MRHQVSSSSDGFSTAVRAGNRLHFRIVLDRALGPGKRAEEPLFVPDDIR
jgi:hypothetical protein